MAAPVEPYAEFATRTLAIAAAERGVVPPRITPIAEIDAFFAHLFADPGLRRLAARRPIAPYETEADIPGARPAEAVAEPDEEAPVLEDLELPEAPSLDAANVATPAVRQRRQRKRRRPSLGRNSNPGLELKKTALKIYFTKKENNSRYGMQDAADEANASRMDGSDKVKKSTLDCWKRDNFGASETWTS